MLELNNGTEMNGVEVNTEATVESMALPGAEAIQHLILERNELRNRTRAQKKELSAPRMKTCAGGLGSCTINTCPSHRNSSRT